MNIQTSNSNSANDKLNAEIQKTWSKLTTAEVALYKSKPEEFFAAVKTKYSINKDEATKTVKSLETACAAACSSSEKAANTDLPAPKAKTANA